MEESRMEMLKVHGSGNDFFILDEDNLEEPLTEEELIQLAQIEVVTPTMSRPSSFTRFPSASTMYLTVEPVPRPTIMPSLIHSTAFVPTNCFNSSWFINYTPFKHRIPKLYNN